MDVVVVIARHLRGYLISRIVYQSQQSYYLWFHTVPIVNYLSMVPTLARGVKRIEAGTRVCYSPPGRL